MIINDDLVDVSPIAKKKIDKITVFVIVSLLILAIGGTLIYFFGYNLFEGFIKI